MNWSGGGVKLSELMLSASLRLYTLLLLIYPRSFRREYGELMIQLFRDLMRDGIRQRGCLGVIKVWWRVVAELPATAWQQHLLAWGNRRERKENKWEVALIVDRSFSQKERSNSQVYLHMIKFPAEMNPATGAEISTQLRSSPFLSFTNWKFGTSVT
jgi:hypothetical protein